MFKKPAQPRKAASEQQDDLSPSEKLALFCKLFHQAHPEVVEE